jgi:drug/metabolite transporter (DMT)-like permease
MSNEVDSVGRRSLPRGCLSLHSIAAMLLLAVMWGLSIPATKLGLQTVPPLTLTAMRFVVAVPLLLVLVIGKERLPWRALPPIAALGVLGISLGQVAQAFGVKGTSASVGTIISATIPVFVVVFAALRLKQPVTGRQQLGLLAAFAGIALVAVGSELEPSTTPESSLTGAAWLLLSAVSIAFYYVWSLELTDEFGTIAVAAWSTLFGFIAMLPFAGWEMWHAPIHITAQAVGVAAYLGVVVTVAGLFLWLHLLRTVPARVAASVQYLQPVVGIAAASAMFGDRLGSLFALGVILILIGLALAVATRRAPEEAVPYE